MYLVAISVDLISQYDSNNLENWSVLMNWSTKTERLPSISIFCEEKVTECMSRAISARVIGSHSQPLDIFSYGTNGNVADYWRCIVVLFPLKYAKLEIIKFIQNHIAFTLAFQMQLCLWYCWKIHEIPIFDFFSTSLQFSPISLRSLMQACKWIEFKSEIIFILCVIL